jgi:hypothetical protein
LLVPVLVPVLVLMLALVLESAAVVHCCSHRLGLRQAAGFALLAEQQQEWSPRE